MPQYSFICQKCKKTFTLLLSVSEYEKTKTKCPHCGSEKVDQQWSAFYAHTSKKS